MPPITVVLYQDERGCVPVRDWLQSLRWKNRKAYARCLRAIERLAENGHELRRPIADYICEGIHELRCHEGHVQFRLLYFFHEGQRAVFVHALTKESTIPLPDLRRAIQRKHEYEKNPQAHTYWEETQGEDDE